MTLAGPTVWDVVQGDVNKTITGVLSGVEDLVAPPLLSIVGQVWRPSDSPEIIELDAAVTNAARREFAVSLGGPSGWLATVTLTGIWLFTVRCTFVDGEELTWPERGMDHINVTPRGAVP